MRPVRVPSASGAFLLAQRLKTEFCLEALSGAMLMNSHLGTVNTTTVKRLCQPNLWKCVRRAKIHADPNKQKAQFHVWKIQNASHCNRKFRITRLTEWVCFTSEFICVSSNCAYKLTQRL